MKAVTRRAALFALGLAMLGAAGGAGAQSPQGEPLKIGFSMALTGGLAANGKAALIAMQIWESDVNAKGGLLGRPVKLVYYDDQSNGASIPGIYTKLLDVDKVDFVVSGYSTAAIVPAMPIVIQRKMVFLGLMGTSVNAHFNYDRYFSMIPLGDGGALQLSKGFVEVAKTIQPEPKRIAVVALDAEFSKAAADGIKQNLKGTGIKVVYDRTYPPSTVDFLPLVRAIQASKPDLVFLASYPVDSAGLIRAIRQTKLSASMVGGVMIGPQIGGFKQQNGPALNNLVTWDIFAPEVTMKFPGVDAFLDKYRPIAAKQGVDPLGFYVPPMAYAMMEVLGQAIEAAAKPDQALVAEQLRNGTFQTIAGEIKFAANGEWAEPRSLLVQYRGIDDSGLDQFKQAGKQVILYPEKYKSGDLAVPFQ